MKRVSLLLVFALLTPVASFANGDSQKILSEVLAARAKKVEELEKKIPKEQKIARHSYWVGVSGLAATLGGFLILKTAPKEGFSGLGQGELGVILGGVGLISAAGGFGTAAVVSYKAKKAQRELEMAKVNLAEARAAVSESAR